MGAFWLVGRQSSPVTAQLRHVFAQELAGARVEKTDMAGVPLRPDRATDPSRRRVVVGRLDLDTAVEMHAPLTVLVEAEGLDGERQEMRPLLGKHGGDLTFGRAVDPRVCPPLLPLFEVRLRLVETLEAQSFERCSLGMADA